jgi:hypothetical protein
MTKSFLEIGKLVPPKAKYQSSRSIVVSWTKKSSSEIGNLSLGRSSAEIVELVVVFMDEKILLGDRELVPQKVEYRSSQISLVSWTRKSSWKIGKLSL